MEKVQPKKGGCEGSSPIRRLTLPRRRVAVTGTSHLAHSRTAAAVKSATPPFATTLAQHHGRCSFKDRTSSIQSIFHYCWEASSSSPRRFGAASPGCSPICTVRPYSTSPNHSVPNSAAVIPLFVSTFSTPQRRVHFHFSSHWRPSFRHEWRPPSFFTVVVIHAFLVQVPR